jgi:nicotinamidase-related amidase
MKNPVLIVIDLQNDYFPGGKWTLSGIEAAAENAARLIAHARQTSQQIIHVRHEFEAVEAPFFVAGSEGAEIHEVAKPFPGEQVVLKHEANAFLRTNLKDLLDDWGSKDLVFVGAMSHNCVDSTVRAASDLGYRATVVHDAVATLDLEFNGTTIPAALVHATFMSALGFAFATIRSTDEQLS